MEREIAPWRCGTVRHRPLMTSADSLATFAIARGPVLDAAYAIEAWFGRGPQREWLPHRIFIQSMVLRPAPIGHNQRA